RKSPKPLFPDKTILRRVALAGWLALLIAGVVWVHPHAAAVSGKWQKGRLQKMVADFFPFYANEPWKETFDVAGKRVYPVRGGLWPSPAVADGVSRARPEEAGELLGFIFSVPLGSRDGKELFTGFDLKGRVMGARPVQKSLFRDKAPVPQGPGFSGSVRDAVRAAVRFFNAHKPELLAAGSRRL
ncbi:MAG: hypothetical protein WC352_01680, partial [Candidatus Omnitrophota bacterium]